MSLHLVADGPEFPASLLRDFALGEVVFLCGAGVSAPQLPDFKKLAEDVYGRNGWEVSPGEKLSYDKGRYEEGLGALARRLADSSAVYDTVAQILAIPAKADLSNHRDLLRLSRRLDNRPTIITTNFDTMFERAAQQREGRQNIPNLSIAGQSLPAPGSTDFAGIIHLHGRLEDSRFGLRRTPLVLTSAEYGDAYMRSGWASRFLFDLTRCRTVVLVGYSANDAPVRYFLNVLEADRDRFSDLRTVYALDAVDGADPQSAKDAWSALAVQTLPYLKRPEGDPGGTHAALWQSIGQLAEIVESPKAARRARAGAILGRPFSECAAAETAIARWALNGQRDMLKVAIDTIVDPLWFDHLIEQRVLGYEDAARVLPTWCAARWTEQSAIDAAVSWSARFGSKFGEYLEREIDRVEANTIDQPWLTGWRLLAISSRKLRREPDLAVYRLIQVFERGEAVEADRREAVKLFAPTISVEQRWRGEEIGREGPASRPRDLFRIEMQVFDEGGLQELSQRLARPADAVRIADIATNELHSAVELARDAGVIGPGWDGTDWDVPSVEEDPQNELHDGFMALVRLLAQLLPVVAERNADEGRRLANEWQRIHARIGTRLALHAKRRPDLFDADTAIGSLVELGHDDFWSIRREWVMLCRERAADAFPATIANLIERIVADAPSLYANLEVGEYEQSDWRSSARDQAAWLRLKAIESANRLIPAGQAALAAIIARQPHLAREIEDQDLFSSYSSSGEWKAGDPTPIVEADEDERLAIAHRLQTSQDFDYNDSWSAYCATDPEGAFEVLKKGEVLRDSSLWTTLLRTLNGRRDGDKAKEAQVGFLQNAFDHLQNCDAGFVQVAAPTLVDSLSQLSRLGAALSRTWWDRLWAAADDRGDDDPLSSTADFYTRVINAPGGKLAETLLQAIDRDRNAGHQPSRGDMGRLRRIMTAASRAGTMGRGALMRVFPFVLSLGEQRVRRNLLPRLNSESMEGAALRSVLVVWAPLHPSATRVAKAALLRGVQECARSLPSASNVAAKILIPILSAFRKDPAPDWGLTGPEVRIALSRASAAVRQGAANWMRQWLTQYKGDPAVGWREYIGPLFRAVWPSDQVFRDATSTNDLAELCMGAGEAFPEALKLVRPYLVPFEGDWARLYRLAKSDVPHRFPAACLDLLWCLCGPPSTSTVHELATILDRISEADTKLAVDRRFQWLEDRAFRT